MRKLNMLLGVVLVPLALAACESTHPLAQMGPQSARYITANYRQSFRAALSDESRPTAAAAEATSVAAGERQATPAEPAVDLATRTDEATEVEVELVEDDPAAASAAGSAKRNLPLPPRQRARTPVAVSVPSPSAARATAARTATSAGLPEPLRWAKRDYSQLGSHTPAPPATQRRFVRLRLTELDGTPVQARDVRPVLRAIVGVQDAVLNETTGTAVVVVDPTMDAEKVIEELAGRYRATVVR